MRLFSIFRSRPKQLDKDIDLSVLHTDIHSHLIPGVDDGSSSLEESIFLIKALRDLGFKKLITTPHHLYNSFPDGTSILDEKLLELRQEIEKQGIDIELDLGVELMLDDDISEMIKKGEIRTFGDNNLLFEIPMNSEVYGLDQWLFDLQLAGYNLILAHPERYSYFFKNSDIFDSFKDRGILMQLNTMSISGYYGPDIKDSAEWMIDNNYVDLLGSDCHGERHIHAIKNTLRSPYLKKLIDSGRLKNKDL